MTRRQIAVFIAGLLAVSWIGQWLILSAHGGVDAPGARPLLLAIMFLPGVFGLAFTVTSKRVRRSVEWKPSGFVPILVGALLPVLIAFLALAVLTGGGLGSSDYFGFDGDAVTVRSGPWILGTGSQAWPMFLANVFVTALVYAALTGLATIGEEYGWRGVLQNSMIRELGFGRGVALLGLVWGLWHFPIILSGYNYPKTPVLGAFVFMPLLLVSASFVMAWLTLWNRSFWPAVFMHGAINSVYDGMTTKVTLTPESPYTMKLIELGVFAAFAAVAFHLARPMARRIVDSA